MRGRATEIKWIGPALLVVWEKFMAPSNFQHVQILGALKRQVEIDNLVDTREMDEYVLRPDVATRLVDCTFEYLALFSAIGRHYAERGWNLFDLTIKGHVLAHLALNGKYLHPKLGTCYQGEDFMKLSKRLLQNCTRGTKPALISKKMIEQFRVGMHMDFVNYSM